MRCGRCTGRARGWRLAWVAARAKPVARLAFCGGALVLSAAPLDAEWAVGAYLGAARMADSSIHLVQPSTATDVRLRGVRFQGRSFDRPLYYGLRAGYFPLRSLGVEAEFVHLKVYAELDRMVRTEGVVRGAQFETQIPMREIAQQFSISHGLNLLLGNVIFRRPFGAAAPDAAPVSAQIRLGAGPTIPHPEIEVLGAKDEHYQWGRIAVQGAGGIQVRIRGGLYALAEYKYTWSDQRLRLQQGRASLIVQSHHVVGGLGYHFARR